VCEREWVKSVYVCVCVCVCERKWVKKCVREKESG
jgi:hypothetical protein